MINSCNKINKLDTEICTLRDSLHSYIDLYGINSNKTVERSKLLDKKLNELHALTKSLERG